MSTPRDESAPLERSSLRALIVGMGFVDEQPGGLNRFVSEIARALQQQNVEIAVLAAGDRGRRRRAGLVPTGEGSLWKRLATIAREARARHSWADIVDSHFALYGLPVQVL